MSKAVSTTSAAAATSTQQHFYNLYFFRNMISNKVFISKTFQANELAALRQMRMNRNQLKLRKDHFVNFMVLTGIKNREIQGRDGNGATDACRV